MASPKRWRSGIRSKRTGAAVAVSVGLHGLVIGYLVHRSFFQTASVKRGVVSFDLIESVHHEAVPVAKPAFDQPQPEAPPTQAPAGVPAEAPAAYAAETDAYILSVFKIINQRKVYPPESIDRGEEGRVVVAVSVAADGEILDTRIEEPGPFPRLNTAALQTVANIKTFPPLPSGISAPVHLHVPLIYRVEN